MKKILVINGPNLNLLGKREPEIYGTRTLEEIQRDINSRFPQARIEWWHSNHEGTIIDRLHTIGFDDSYTGIVMNAGAFTHTSLAIADAISAIKLPVIEVHLSNVFSREEIRHHSLIAGACIGSISGFGEDSYALAITYLCNMK